MSVLVAAPAPARTTRRGPVLFWGVVVLLLVAVSVFVATRPTSSSIPRDPDSPGPGGGQAMARVLADQGVEVTPVRRLDDLLAMPADQQTTVFVANPDGLKPGQLQTVLDHFSTAHRVVVLAASPNDLDGRVGGGDGSQTGCTIAWLDGLRAAPQSQDQTYSPRAAGQQHCLATDNGYLAVTLDDRVVLLGATGAVTNDSVLRGDNAAIGLRALGSSQRLLWLSADLGSVQSDDEQGGGLPWPAWWRPALLLVGGATVALMLWRGRRLGRLVREPLPVVVPAQETTTARARLYRKAQDTDRAARVLRAATRARLSAYLGDPDPVRATARHTGRPEPEVAALLLDSPVAGERELVSLANELSTLERQVRPQ